MHGRLGSKSLFCGIFCRGYAERPSRADESGGEKDQCNWPGGGESLAANHEQTPREKGVGDRMFLERLVKQSSS